MKERLVPERVLKAPAASSLLSPMSGVAADIGRVTSTCAGMMQRLGRGIQLGICNAGLFVTALDNQRQEHGMWRATDKFNAVGTSGEEYVIVEMTDLPEGASPDTLDPQGLRSRKHALEDGRELSTEKDGTFIIVETEEVLKAVSPSAPAGT